MAKILAIDDNNDNLITLKAICKDAFPDAVLYCALNGKKGIEHAIEYDPDVIILDVIMPEMDGFEVCRQLKLDKRVSDIPVVFLTATKADKENRIKALDTGAEAFLSKPIDITELTAQIRAMVKIKQANEQKRNEEIRLKKLVDERTQKLELSQKETLKLLQELKEENEVRRKTEEALRESEKRYRLLVEQSPTGIAIHQEGKFVYINPAGLTIFGAKDPEDILGKSVLSVVHPESNYARMTHTKGITNGYAVPSEEKLIRFDGSVFLGEVISLTIQYNEKPAGQVIVWDITERKRIEKELINAKEKAEESDRLKSAFLANMSHEIRTPLNSIIGFADLLNDSFYDQNQHKEFAKLIKMNGNNLLSIINDIMDISLIEAGTITLKKQMFSVNQLLIDIVEELSFKATEKNIQIKLELPQENIVLKSDEMKIKQILINLIGNAIKFTDNGFIFVRIEKVDDFVNFKVKDTGIGIPRESHNLVFERFRQLEGKSSKKYGGNGLGLSICKSFIEILGGKIWIDSDEGKGSTFYFNLPI